MKERDPEKLDRIVKAVTEALADLLAHLKENGIEDWLDRYSEVQAPLHSGDHAAVVELAERNHKLCFDDADRMDIICHYLDTPPPEEVERLDRGLAQYGKYDRAFNRTFLFRDLCDRCLRVYTTYGFFNDPQTIIDDNNRMQAIVASAPKPDS